jgi:outer membrane murein-binding lipoprotein Lpp
LRTWANTVSENKIRARRRKELVRTWVSGGRSSDVIDKLRREIEELEAKKDKLMDENKPTVFEWTSRMMRSAKVNDELTRKVGEIVAEFDSITQEIVEKEVTLSERLDEQTKLDSLG